MASPSIAAEYPNSEHSGSGKDRPAFKAEEIEKFFATCPENIVPARFLRLLRGMWLGSADKEGRRPFGADIQLAGGTRRYQEGCGYKSDRTVRYNIPAAVDLGLLEIAYRDPARGTHHIWIRKRSENDKGFYRRVTTYRLPVSLLVRWRDHHHKVREMPARKQPESTPPPKAPAPARREEPQRKTAEHRSPERAEKPSQPKLTRRECAKFWASFEQRRRGRNSYFSRGDGLAIALHPGEDGYAAPMSRKDAFLAECAAWGREPDAVRDSLKAWGYKIEPEDGA